MRAAPASAIARIGNVSRLGDNSLSIKAGGSSSERASVPSAALSRWRVPVRGRELRDTGEAMSRANVDLVRSIYERWAKNRSARDLIDDELEYVNPPYAVESGTRQGRSALSKIRDVYPDFHVEPEQFIDAGDDVVVIGIARGTSVSGVEAQWRQGYVWTVAGGQAVRFQWFNDPAEALDAVGPTDNGSQGS